MDTGKTIQTHLMKHVDKMKGLNFVETLSVTFEKYTEDSIIITTIFFKNKIKTVINTKDIDEDLLISIQEIRLIHGYQKALVGLLNQWTVIT